MAASTFSKNLVIFASYTATGAQTGIRELVNVTDAPLSFNSNAEPVNVFGVSTPVAYDSLEPETVDLSLTWNVGGLHNEKSLGFRTDGTNFLTDILNGNQTEKNYYYAQSPEGTDAVGLDGTDFRVIGIGNAVVQNYSFNAAVGQYATASATIQGYAARATADGVGEDIPSIDRATSLPITGVTYTLPTASGMAAYGQPPIIKPGDIKVDLSNASGIFQSLTGENCVQSVSIDFDLGRDNRSCLGTRLPDTSLSFPIEVNFSVEYFTKEFATGTFQNFLCNTGLQSATVTLRKPTCVGNSGDIAAVYELRGLRLVSQETSTPLQTDPSTTTLNYVGYIGGINTTGVGLFASGLS